MRKKPEVFCKRVVAFRRPENIQKAIKHSYRERRPKFSSNKSRWRRAPMAQPRNADSRSKGNAVEDKNLITHERAHQSKFLNETQIPDKMIERVSEASRGKYCGDRKSTRLNSSHLGISYAVFCLK